MENFIKKNIEKLINIVTNWETLLCLDESGRLCHSLPANCAMPVFILNVKGGAWLVSFSKNMHSRFLVWKENSYVFSNEGEPATFQIGGSNQDGISLVFDGNYLSCVPDGSVNFNARCSDKWESLALISAKTLKWFENTQEEKWFDVLTGSRFSFKGFKKEATKTYIDCGTASYRLSGRPGPIVASGSQRNRVTIFDSFQRSRNAFLYNPLVYFCVFGDDYYYSCCVVAIISLRRFGKYSGDIIVICDKNESDFLSLLPPDVSVRVIVKTDFCSTKMDMIFKRYSIFDFGVEKYYPILYLDTDIIVSDDINYLIFNA